MDAVSGLAALGAALGGAVALAVLVGRMPADGEIHREVRRAVDRAAAAYRSQMQALPIGYNTYIRAEMARVKERRRQFLDIIDAASRQLSTEPDDLARWADDGGRA
jgi:hypothetical protein